MSKEMLIMFLLQGILGYLMQHYAWVIGMHGIARQKMVFWRVTLVSAVCAVILYLLRSIPFLQFGVHTMLNCLVTNAFCIMLCKMDIRKSVLGSVIMMIFIMLSDLVNFGFATVVLHVEDITAFLADPTRKALSALPGNFTLLAGALITYFVRIRKVKNSGVTE